MSFWTWLSELFAGKCNEELSQLRVEKIELEKELERIKDKLNVSLQEEGILNEAIENLEGKIKDLEQTIADFNEGTPVENPSMVYWENKYPKTDIFYGGFYDTMKRNYPTDVRTFITPQDAKIPVIKKPTNDESMIAIQKWIIKNVNYVSDKSTYGLEEYWAFPFMTVKLKQADCDDGSILMYSMGLRAGIPWWRLRLAAGDVYSNSGNYLGGHCWLNYLPDAELEKQPSEQDWKVCDWCFNADTRAFNQRPNYKDDVNYGKGSVWFSWNMLHSFSKSTSLTNAKEMLVVKGKK